MALSLGNRRRGQTSTAWASQQQQSSYVSHTHLLNSNQQQQQLLIRKQNSFIESGSTGSSSGRGYLSRGLSVGRTFDNIRQRIIVPQKHTSIRLQKNLSIEQESRLRTNLKQKADQPLKGSNNLNTNFNSRHCSNVNKSGSGIGIGRQRSVVAWSSTSSLLKSLDDELNQVSSGIIERKKNSNNPNQSVDVYLKQEHKIKDSSTNDQFVAHQKPIPIILPGDPSKINLNIVLSQTIKATTENEAAQSDIDSSSEGADVVSSSITQSIKRLESENKAVGFGAVRSTSALHRRAQFHSSRSTTINAASPVTTNTSAVAANNSTFSASPSLTVQRRPPLVRAMSAPVRTVLLDENSKSIIAGSKRKSRRRKLTRSDRTEAICSDNKSKDPNLDDDINGAGRKVLSRARSVAVPDVITLVSLVSSEGSDSEKEDSSATTTTTNSDNSPTRRAPFLRKTGKSVSFQENYPPNFQLAAKEYSHMIRRGSIAPLAARLRSNRPPTAPPVSIFLNDPNTNSDIMTTSPTKDSASCRPAAIESDKIAPKQEQEYIFPDYVRSIKERECWKLYQKMSTKGVNVTYDTILRGMLTPTEFRHLQKQRELEEARVRENEEAAIEADAVKPQPTAIERLSETLLKK